MLGLLFLIFDNHSEQTELHFFVSKIYYFLLDPLDRLTLCEIELNDYFSPCLIMLLGVLENELLSDQLRSSFLKNS